MCVRVCEVAITIALWTCTFRGNTLSLEVMHLSSVIERYRPAFVLSDLGRFPCLKVPLVS